MTAHDRPARARRPRGRLIALALAIAVNLLFVGVLVFSVTWQNRAPAPVTAELYAPPVTTLTPLPAPRLSEVAPPKRLPPTPVLPPVPTPAPKPAPPPPPTPSQADIALKAKQEAAKKKEDEEAKKEAEAKKLAEQRARAVAAMQAQAQRELQARQAKERTAQLRAQAEAESRLRAQAEKEEEDRARQSAAASAASRAEAAWIDRIRSKIRGNVTYLPPESSGNPEALFDVVLLPTGEVLRVQMKKSSGIPAYDDAVQRAIMKSSPLPPPPSPDLFRRELELHFRPHEP